jgi:predicted nucleic acid-binding protein
MHQYVVDASIVVKWVLPGEPYEENSVKLKEDYLSGIINLSAPSFLVQEVANSVWKAITRGRIIQADAHEALKVLQGMCIDLHELNWVEISEALDIASKLNLPIYDASYLLLSEKLKTQVVTADDQMYQKAKVSFKVLHIKNYP